MKVQRVEDSQIFEELLERIFARNTTIDIAGKFEGKEEDRLRANLLLSISRRMNESPAETHERYIVKELEDSISDRNSVKLIAVRTPPLPLVIGFGEPTSTIALAEALGNGYPDYTLSGIVGRTELVEAFCERYFSITKINADSVMKQLLHVLKEYSPPQRHIPGQVIFADVSHKDMLISWTMQFAIDAKLGEHEKTYDYCEGLVSARLEERSIFLWVIPATADSNVAFPVSIAFSSLCHDDMIRIGMVFTPAEHRNHGYASILVNSLSKYFLDLGKTCLLYTDADNPISNSIYYQIGYRVISDERVVRFI